MAAMSSGKVRLNQSEKLGRLIMSLVFAVSDFSFDGEVLKSDQPVLVNFFAPWSAPSLEVGKIVEELSVKYVERIKVVKLDVDQNLDTPSRYRIHTLPAIMVFKRGKEVARLEKIIEKSNIEQTLETLSLSP
ncbi:thioredoxin domain-containing protein [Oscillatoria sp. FACHB-1406]|uniref:thioredoxin family protein n=1 Tax=Oscillatoria sp. FACHB-1406 TaxID=2692846 RepID=UPI001685B44A|nr:thioredoxin domain-containing protein [Oscillatoria sp. FACHB-1406]MBD2579605.1 thiol reductase thioredoxin [Oscillatoria sp. FACHB-1406]